MIHPHAKHTRLCTPSGCLMTMYVVLVPGAKWVSHVYLLASPYGLHLALGGPTPTAHYYDDSNTSVHSNANDGISTPRS